jgi:hypothetical protein
MIKKDKSIFPISDRRLSPRYPSSDVPFLQNVTFDEASDVQVLNISRGGVLLETGVRLCPQTKIWMELTTRGGIFETQGQVLRCSITALKEKPNYQAAISFEIPFHLMDSLSNIPAESFPNTKSAATMQSQNNPQSVQTAPGGDADHDVTTLRVVAHDKEDESSIA